MTPQRRQATLPSACGHWQPVTVALQAGRGTRPTRSTVRLRTRIPWPITAVARAWWPGRLLAVPGVLPGRASVPGSVDGSSQRATEARSGLRLGP